MPAGQGTHVVLGLLSVSLVPGAQRKSEQVPLRPVRLRLVPGSHEVQGVAALRSPSSVPTGQTNALQLPEEFDGTNKPKPGTVHCTQAVDALRSASMRPAWHTKAAQLPLCPVGTNAPGGHHVHAVVGFKSPSMVPSGQAKELQLPERPRTLRSVPGSQVVHMVLLFLS